MTRSRSGANPARTPSAPRRVLMVAGEASGDLHGADLLRALRARLPALEVFGIGGAGLRAGGMETVVDASDVAIVGLVEGASHLRTLLRVYRTLVRRLREDPPDLCILIDFPEFNLRLARAARRAGVPVLYYIGPQVWAWRRGRVRTIARRVDRLAVVFPFEPALYAGHTAAVEFVGHPLLDRVSATRGREVTLTSHGLDPTRPLVLLLPGSRRKEIEHLLPTMLDAARILAEDPRRQFALGLAPTVPRADVETIIGRQRVPVAIVGGDTYNLMAAADLALVTSGTATLECALLGCPMVVVYRMSSLTYAVGRLLVRGVRHIAMPNIVAGHAIVPELLQGAASGSAIAAAARDILDRPGRRDEMVRDLRAVRTRLGRGGAAARAADIAVEMLGGTPGMKTYRRLLAYLRPYMWPRGVLAIGFMLGFSALESSVPFIVRYTFDQVFTQQQAAALSLAVVAVVGVGVIRGVLGFGASYLMDWVGQRVITDLRNELTRHMQTLDLAFFNKQRAGQIVSRVTADVTLVRNAVTDAVKSVFQDTTTLVGLIVVAVYLDWVLAILGLLLFPLAGLPIRYLSTQLRLTSRKQQEATGRLNAMLHENVQGNRVVKVFGQEAFEAGRLQVQDERIFQLFMRASRMRSLPVTEVLAGFAIALIIWYGGSSVIAGTRTQGNFVAFVITLVLLYEPFKKLVRTNYTIQTGLAGAERAFGLLDQRPTVVDRPGARTLAPVQHGIEFHDVGFAYDPGEPVLRDVALRIPVGHVVALVGMSGGGKSTLADLIPRLYDVTDGKITIDGVDIRDVTLASLRRQIAVVTQFTFLWNDSVRSNIAFGEPNRPLDDVIAAARAANAHEFITNLPQGYETTIGDLGVRLSGGQRQRLAIARAILKNAPILILDEATSALDTESEGLVQDAVDRLMMNRTSVVVAHRLSTIRRADLIVVVSHGRIVERGTHEQLLARGGEYRKLYELQFGEGEIPGPAAVAAAE